MAKFLSIQASRKLIEIAKYPPPPHIQKLKDEIAGKIRVAELRASLNGDIIDEDLVTEIVALKLELDGLYCSLVENEPVV